MTPTRTTELIGMDVDGQMYVWDTGQVRPVSAFKRDGPRIKCGHFVIHWKDHAIVVHCGNMLIRGKRMVSVLFMCSDGPVLYLPRAEVEAMLLGQVIEHPEVAAETIRALRECHEALSDSQQAPQRKRGRI